MVIEFLQLDLSMQRAVKLLQVKCFQTGNNKKFLVLSLYDCGMCDSFHDRPNLGLSFI